MTFPCKVDFYFSPFPPTFCAGESSNDARTPSSLEVDFRHVSVRHALCGNSLGGDGSSVHLPAAKLCRAASFDKTIMAKVYKADAIQRVRSTVVIVLALTIIDDQFRI